MAKTLPVGMTHEYYFDKHSLSVEQYGEILVKVAFDGTKMPDNHKGYDVNATIDGRPARIEVKSKLKEGGTGPATVVHCNDNKFGSDGMTHLVVLVNRIEKREEDGHSVDQAWLLSSEQAERLRTNTKSKYISVRQLRKEAVMMPTEIVSITETLRNAARSSA